MHMSKVSTGAAADVIDLSGVARVHRNLTEPALMQAAVARGEGVIGQGGALLVNTGKHTGRSPKDKFVVRTPSVEDTIWWDNNKPMAPDAVGMAMRDIHAMGMPPSMAPMASSV